MNGSVGSYAASENQILSVKISPARRRSELAVNRLDLSIELQRMYPQFAAKAGLLIAAEGRDDIRAALTVDQNSSGLKRARQAVGAADVARPYGGSEAIDGIVALEH